MSETPDTLAAEFDMLLRRAGLTVSAERQAQVLPGYADLCEQVKLLRGSLTAADEPSNVFHLTPLKAG